MGQNAWEPKHLHPFTQDESVLTSTQLRTGGDDTKWQIAADGWYRITVDVFRETFHADYLGTSPTEGQPTGINIKHNEECIMHNAPSVIYDLQGRKVEPTVAVAKRGKQMLNVEKLNKQMGQNRSTFAFPASRQRPLVQPFNLPTLKRGIYIIGGKKVVIK